MAAITAVLVLVLAVGSCSDDSDSPSESANPDGSSEIARCESDDTPATTTTAPPGSITPTTIGPLGQAAIDGNAYGSGFPDTYAGAAVDTASGVVQIGFTADVEEHQAALDEQLGEGTVTVVAMDNTLDALGELRDEMADQLIVDEVAVDVGLNLRDNVVAVNLVEVDDASIAAVAEAFPGEPICVQ